MGRHEKTLQISAFFKVSTFFFSKGVPGMQKIIYPLCKNSHLNPTTIFLNHEHGPVISVTLLWGCHFLAQLWKSLFTPFKCMERKRKIAFWKVSVWTLFNLVTIIVSIDYVSLYLKVMVMFLPRVYSQVCLFKLQNIEKLLQSHIWPGVRGVWKP